MEASSVEIAHSKVLCLIEEIGGKPIDKTHWQGYHPEAYGKNNVPALNSLTATLCGMLEHDIDVLDYSLEMQMWWRNHQEADERRKKAEADAERLGLIRRRAIEKLTPEEREALGVKDD